jgi:hypothetical protein
VPIDLDTLEDAFLNGALCFLDPTTGEVFVPRKWSLESRPGHVRVPAVDRKAWGDDFILAYVTDPQRQQALRAASAAGTFAQALDEREQVQWSAYSSARTGMDLRAWLEKLGICVIPRRTMRWR